MIAKDFADKYGKKAIGKLIMCQAVGCYPGGPATIVGLKDDDENIVLYVESKLGNMGILWDEWVEIIPSPKPRKGGKLRDFRVSIRRVYEDTMVVKAVSQKGAEILVLSGQGKPDRKFGPLLSGISLWPCKGVKDCGVRDECTLCSDD